MALGEAVDGVAAAVQTSSRAAFDLQTWGLALWGLYGPFMERQETPAGAICCLGHFSLPLCGSFAFVSLAEQGSRESLNSGTPFLHALKAQPPSTPLPLGGC